MFWDFYRVLRTSMSFKTLLRQTPIVFEVSNDRLPKVFGGSMNDWLSLATNSSQYSKVPTINLSCTS